VCAGATDNTQICVWNHYSSFGIGVPVGVTFNQSMYMDGSTQTESLVRNIGITRRWGSSQPSLIQFDMYNVRGNPSFSGEGGNVEFWYEGDPSITSDDRMFFRMFWTSNGTANGQNLAVGWATDLVGGKKAPDDHKSTPFDNDYQPSYGLDKVQAITSGHTVSYSLYLRWDTYVIDVWANFWPNKDYKLIFEGVPFRYHISAFERMDIYNNNANSPKYFFTNMKLCNAAGGAAYQPLTKGSRIAQSNSNMRSKIAGQIDFGYQTKEVNNQIQESSNYKLKGGDSSKVDLLNTRNAATTFHDWKATIPQNPAPVAFTLRSISFLFQKDEVQMQDAASEAVYMVSPRAQMDAAIDDFLVTKEVGEISFTKAADTPGTFAQSAIIPTIQV